MVCKATKLSLKPNKTQEKLILKTIASSRFVFNYFLIFGILLTKKQKAYPNFKSKKYSEQSDTTK